LQTLTASFPGSSFDESEDARLTAERLNFPHATVQMPPTLSNDFSRIVADLDEPFADPSSFPTWYLCQDATRRFKVVLGGDGLDELMGGYKRTWKHLRTRWRRNLSAPWLPISPSASAKGWAKWSAECKMSWLESYSLRFSGFAPSQRRYLQPDFRPQTLTYWRPPAGESKSPLASLLEIDIENYLPEYVLRKGDLCSMAHGLELRAPFLDHHWVQAVAAVPESDLFTQPPKRILEQVCPGLTSLELFGRKKRGFNPPLTSWLSFDLRERFESLGERLDNLTHGQISAAAVDAYCRRHLGAKKWPEEQFLQLLILDESLAQLRALAQST
jgi:asparagine synthase (glutamine-hydrolysing)